MSGISEQIIMKDLCSDVSHILYQLGAIGDEDDFYLYIYLYSYWRRRKGAADL